MEADCPPDLRASSTRRLRLGVLGTAHITPTALLGPARRVTGVEVVAIASRDEARARRFAARFGIPHVHHRYEDVLADPAVDAIYVPLPTSLHAEWTIRALEAGKHVLCEKPMASNAAEAARVTAAAAKAGRVLAEGLHWRGHPLARRMKEIVGSGALGRVRHIEATLTTLRMRPTDIRYRFDLGGGALMDLGCYAVDIVRYLAEADPEVVSVDVHLASARVDRWIRTELRFPDGRTARITCALLSASLFSRWTSVTGEAGDMRVINPLAPHLFNRLSLRSAAGRTVERVPGDATYDYQLRTFARAVWEGTRPVTDAENGLANMRIIDAVYRKAGLPLRGG